MRTIQIAVVVTPPRLCDFGPELGLGLERREIVCGLGIGDGLRVDIELVDIELGRLVESLNGIFGIDLIDVVEHGGRKTTPVVASDPTHDDRRGDAAAE